MAAPGTRGPPSVRMHDADSCDDSECLEQSESSSQYFDEGSDVGGLEEVGPGSSRERSLRWRIIDSSQLKRAQETVVEGVVAILGCCASVAKSVLMHYMWDKEKLMSDLAERGPEHCFQVAGVVATQREVAASPPGPDERVNCAVCISDVPATGCTTNGCGHTFCDTCWQSHLSVQIRDGHARHIRCMAFKCGVVIDERLVLRVMKVMEDAYVEPECSCGVAFCFKCGKAPHSPCTCRMWQMWDEKVTGDSETRNWLMANTKPCPKCTKPVEKNGGCNLVVCKCGQPFCWLCGSATGMAHTWSNIEGHNCGRWKDDVDARVSEAMRNHKRYMHYFERYKQHDDSLRKEKANRVKLLERISDCEADGVEARDYSWLVTALDQLRAARRVLSNSYAFAYFFFLTASCLPRTSAPSRTAQTRACLRTTSRCWRQRWSA